VTGFRKKTYRHSEFWSDLFKVTKSLPALASIRKGRKVNGALREKVMLAVTGVNECRYCAFVHSNMARMLDVPKDEIERIMESGNSGDPGSDEQPAIEFARHYAQTNQQPEPDMVSSFRKYYGNELADSLLRYMRMIYFASLFGNTFDAFLWRLKGKPG